MKVIAGTEVETNVPLQNLFPAHNRLRSRCYHLISVAVQPASFANLDAPGALHYFRVGRDPTEASPTSGHGHPRASSVKFARRLSLDAGE